MDDKPQPPPNPDPIGPPRPRLEPGYWKGRHSNHTAYALIIIFVLLIVGLIVWHQWPAPKPAPKATTQTQPVKTAPATPQPTQSYTSPNFNLTLTYPQDWTVTDSGAGNMSVRSPVTGLTSASGQSLSGQIVLTIAKKGTSLGNFSQGNATAVLASQKIAYTKPTQNQRANTYLTFARYAQDSTAGALDAIYITGDFGYQKAQDILKTDLAKIDPLISVSFVKCANVSCPASSASALSIAASSWSDSTFSAPILKMLESLQLN